MNFRALTQSDLKYMKAVSPDKEFYKDGHENISFDHVLEHNGDILVIGGLRFVNKTTAIGWFDISPAGYENLLAVYRTICEWMDGYRDSDGHCIKGIIEELGIIRLEAYVKESFGKGIRTVEHLGFEFERTVKKFFGTEDALLFVKFYDKETE